MTENLQRKLYLALCARSRIITYHVSSEDPKDVVEKETTKENTSGQHVVQMQKFNAIDSKSQPKNIVSNPVFFPKVPNSNTGAQSQGDQVVGGELVLDQLLVLDVLT